MWACVTQSHSFHITDAPTTGLTRRYVVHMWWTVCAVSNYCSWHIADTHHRAHRRHLTNKGHLPPAIVICGDTTNGKNPRGRDQVPGTRSTQEASLHYLRAQGKLIRVFRGMTTLRWVFEVRRQKTSITGLESGAWAVLAFRFWSKSRPQRDVCQRRMWSHLSHSTRSVIVSLISHVLKYLASQRFIIANLECNFPCIGKHLLSINHIQKLLYHWHWCGGCGCFAPLPSSCKVTRGSSGTPSREGMSALHLAAAWDDHKRG